MAVMILKNCNIFKKEDNKEMEKHIRQFDNNSRESLMAEKCHYKQALRLTNEQLKLFLQLSRLLA
jgi:hypothetical protein